MKWYEIFVLSNIEILAFLVLWSKLNPNFYKYKVRSLFTIAALSGVSVILDYYTIDIGFVISFALLCTMVTILFQTRLEQTLLQFFIVLIFALSVQMIVTYILSIIQEDMSYSFSNGLKVNIATFIICVIIYRTSWLNRIQKLSLSYYRVILTIIVNVAGVIVLFFYIWQVDKAFIWNHYAVLLTMILIWEGLNIYFIYQMIKMRQQEKIIQVHEKYTPFLENLVHEVRQRQHEFKNHLNVLYGLAEMQDDYEAKQEIKNYLQTLIDKIKPVDKLLNIKDHILSAVIYSKKALAQEKKIAFHVEFQGEIPEYPLDKHELVELLGNLLNNAIEAAENGENGSVVLTLGMEGKFKMIRVKNTGKSISRTNTVHIYNRGYSTKEGKHRGYGLYNVKKIVDAYNGTIELSFEEKHIVFTVLF